MNPPVSGCARWYSESLGATEDGVFALLSSDYIKLVLLAVLVAVPIVWFTMERWLESFPHRISISSFTFVIAAVGALSISLLTVSFQTLKASRANPVDSLRYE